MIQYGKCTEFSRFFFAFFVFLKVIFQGKVLEKSFISLLLKSAAAAVAAAAAADMISYHMIA